MSPVRANQGMAWAAALRTRPVGGTSACSTRLDAPVSSGRRLPCEAHLCSYASTQAAHEA